MGESMAVMDAGGDKARNWPQRRRFYGRTVAIALFVMSVVLLHGGVTLAVGGPRVILLRGWFGVFSTGLDGVASELKAHGVDAEVAGHLSWQNEVTEILHERSAGRTGWA